MKLLFKVPGFGQLVAAAALMLASISTHAAFSLTTEIVKVSGGTEKRYRVDTDAGLVFSVRASGTDGGRSNFVDGDITNLIYRGIDYQSPAAGSHVNSGANHLFGGVQAVWVSADVLDAAGRATPASALPGGVVQGGAYVRITVTVYSPSGKPFVHTYMARRGVPQITMGTYFEQEPDETPFVRFIARIPKHLLPYGPTGEAGAAGSCENAVCPQDVGTADQLIEAADIFTFSGGPLKGQTRSKHYSNARQIDWRFLGGRNAPTAARSTVGIWLHAHSNEGSSGGPFYRSLLQSIGYKPTGDNNELTYMVNYGMAQTESYRVGALNTYTLMFTDGAAPTSAPATGWLDQMGLQGHVAARQRGGVGVLGINSTVKGDPFVVGLSNERAQYWTTVDPATGRYVRGGMLPGSYTLTVYRRELPVYVAPQPVTVMAGSTTVLHTISVDQDPQADTPLWRIGRWDGTPREFVNGARLTSMHPSDVRMAPWTQTEPYLVDSSQPETGFPAYQWRDVNPKVSIRFYLGEVPADALTLRVGTTTEFKAAVPKVSVNDGVWTSPAPTSRPANGSRNLTVGTYRGINRIHSFVIPPQALRPGLNQIDLSVLSGIAGTGFLSPGLAYDAIDLLSAR